MWIFFQMKVAESPNSMQTIEASTSYQAEIIYRLSVAHIQDGCF